MPAPRHPDDLARHNCVRFRFAGTGAIYKWEFQVDDRLVEYEVKGNLTISDTLFSMDAALEGIGLAYTFEQLALPSHPGQAAEAGVDLVLADVSRVLPVLPQQARPADEIESAHRVCEMPQQVTSS